MANNDFELEYPTYDTNVCPTRENYWKAKLIVQRYETYQYNFSIYKDKPEGSIPRMTDRDAMIKDAVTLAMSEGLLYGQNNTLINLIQEFASKKFSEELSKEYFEKLNKSNLLSIKPFLTPNLIIILKTTTISFTVLLESDDEILLVNSKRFVGLISLMLSK